MNEASYRPSNCDPSRRRICTTTPRRALASSFRKRSFFRRPRGTRVIGGSQPSVSSAARAEISAGGSGVKYCACSVAIDKTVGIQGFRVCPWEKSRLMAWPHGIPWAWNRRQIHTPAVRSTICILLFGCTTCAAVGDERRT